VSWVQGKVGWDYWLWQHGTAFAKSFQGFWYVRLFAMTFKKMQTIVMQEQVSFEGPLEEVRECGYTFRLQKQIRWSILIYKWILLNNNG
jgi:hypothetical protein